MMNEIENLGRTLSRSELRHLVGGNVHKDFCEDGSGNSKGTCGVHGTCWYEFDGHGCICQPGYKGLKCETTD